MDSRAISISTTPAMPTTDTSDAFTRSGNARRFMAVTAMICLLILMAFDGPGQRPANPSTMRSRAARSAGSAPATTPSATINASPRSRACGVNRNAERYSLRE